MEGPALGDMETKPLLPSTQSMRLLASDLQRMDIAQLDPEALGNIKKLSVSLVASRTHRASSSFLGLAPLRTVSGARLHCSRVLFSFPQGIVTMILLPSRGSCPSIDVDLQSIPEHLPQKFHDRIKTLPHSGSWCQYLRARLTAGNGNFLEGVSEGLVLRSPRESRETLNSQAPGGGTLLVGCMEVCPLL